jgi:hypothetical protein
MTGANGAPLSDGAVATAAPCPPASCSGLVQYSGWFFPHVLADLREAEQALRDHPHLTIGALLDPVSWKFVSRRNGSVKR